MKSKIFFIAFLALVVCSCEDPNVTLNTYKLVLYAGQDTTLVATCDNPLSDWTTSNDFVVSCDDGNVHAQHIGTASIYVHNYFSSYYTATCEVIVLPNYIYWAEPYLKIIDNKENGIIGKTMKEVKEIDGIVSVDSISNTSFITIDTVGVKTIYHFTESNTTTDTTYLYSFAHCDMYVGEKFSETEINNYINERFIYIEKYCCYQDGEIDNLSKKRMQKIEDEETHKTILRFTNKR